VQVASHSNEQKHPPLTRDAPDGQVEHYVKATPEQVAHEMWQLIILGFIDLNYNF